MNTPLHTNDLLCTIKLFASNINAKLIHNKYYYMKQRSKKSLNHSQITIPQAKIKLCKLIIHMRSRFHKLCRHIKLEHEC